MGTATKRPLAQHPVGRLARTSLRAGARTCRDPVVARHADCPGGRAWEGGPQPPAPDSRRDRAGGSNGDTDDTDRCSGSCGWFCGDDGLRAQYNGEDLALDLGRRSLLNQNKELAVDPGIVDLGARPSRKRTRRQIAGQHRNIERLFLTLARAVSDRRKSETRAGFNRYRTVISDHFALEEQVFFPAIQIEDPGRKPAIESLIRSHDRLLDELAQMEAQLESLSREDFSRRLHGFATMLAIHENKEEVLVAATANVQVA